MLKFCTSYLAGALSIAGAVFYAGTRTNAAMFFAGVLVALVALAAALSSRARILRAARFLDAIASASRNTKKPRESVPLAMVEPLTDPERDVISALENMGLRRALATRTTLVVSRSLPAAGRGISFEELLRKTIATLPAKTGTAK